MDAKMLKQWAKMTESMSKDIEKDMKKAVGMMTPEQRKQYDEIIGGGQLNETFETLKGKINDLRKATKTL